MAPQKALTISVVIPTIGRQSLLRAIDSVCTQIGVIINEIVVCFDNTENTILNINEYFSKYGTPIKVVYNTGPKGVAATLNCAIDACTSPLISWLSDDDFFSSPINLLHYNNIINRNNFPKDRIFLFSDFMILDESIPLNNDARKGILNPQLHYVGAHIENFGSHYASGIKNLSKGLINGYTSIFSKHLWKLVGGFPVHKSLQTIQDTVFWMLIAEKSLLTVYTEGAYKTIVKHPLQSTHLLKQIPFLEIEQLKIVVQLKLLSYFQCKKFTLKDFFNFFYNTTTLGISPTSVFNLPAENTIRQLAEFELEQNSIAIVYYMEMLPDESQKIAIWNMLVESLQRLLGNAEYNSIFFSRILHVYICTAGSIKRVNITQNGADEECPMYNQCGDIMYDYRYIITVNDYLNENSSIHANLKLLLTMEDLSELWSHLNDRNFHLSRPNSLIVRAPWAFNKL